MRNDLDEAYLWIRKEVSSKNIDAVVDFRTSISVRSRGNYDLLCEGTPVRLKE